MSPQRWALSVFIVWHVLAIALGSLASPGAVVRVGPPRHPEHDAIAAVLTPPLDSVASVMEPLPDGILRSAGPLRRLSALYLRSIGVSQSWKMFSNPPNVNWYLRARYYVGRPSDADRGSADAAWRATELVFPAEREDEMRLFSIFQVAARDKAMSVALQRFHGRRDDTLIRANTTSAELPDDLAPIARYFARRFERQALQPGERIVRTEIWFGVAPVAAPGRALERGKVEARLEVLRDYYEGPIEDHFGRPEYPVYHVVEREADIEWVLEYYEP